MDVISSLRARLEGPLRDDDTIVLDLERGCCLHVLGAATARAEVSKSVLYLTRAQSAEIFAISRRYTA
jgi:hypothetical protein